MEDGLLRTAVTGLGAIVTGRFDAPFADGDTVVMEDGRVAAIGRAADHPLGDMDLVVDAQGGTAAPGLIDSHVHTVIGDFTPRQKTVDFLESYLHGGITRAISASEIHAPGRPRDPAGIKALALAAQRCFQHYRPGGITVHGGSLILEPGLVEADFAELAREGVRLAKGGFGDFRRQAEAAPMVRWAQRYGMTVMVHTGGASIPTSSPVTADDLMDLLPDVSGHTNGGPTALPDADVGRVIADSRMALQVVQAGNLRSALLIARTLRDRGDLGRLLIASDTPTGTGMMPLAVLKSVVEISSLAPLPPEVALAAATGNVGAVYRLEAGVLAPGRPADLIVLNAPLGSVARTALEAASIGDIPAITACFTSGVLRYLASRNTPAAARGSRVVRENLRLWT
jgi:enamidase